jgi:hypothetical protein
MEGSTQQVREQALLWLAGGYRLMRLTTWEEWRVVEELIEEREEMKEDGHTRQFE